MCLHVVLLLLLSVLNTWLTVPASTVSKRDLASSFTVTAVKLVRRRVFRVDGQTLDHYYCEKGNTVEVVLYMVGPPNKSRECRDTKSINTYKLTMVYACVTALPIT